MGADRQKIESLFEAARARPTQPQRQAYLDAACGGDPDLRQQVESLLHAYEQAGSFLQAPVVGLGATTDVPIGEKPGAVIGPYKLLEQIGEGGYGVVFMAEQSHPVQRKVALKVIKPGMDSKQVIGRFEAERRALARTDHPHIARVLDAGTTDSGRPYFVMELVSGIPITRYCDQQKLTPRQRLELFVPVCRAIQHAHQKGIIHRDLKPSNVLIALYDGKPVPKVIDFGVAKATDQKLTEQTLFTGSGAVVGTLEYMSPEQAELNQLDVDTRSDIYSLGVILYELLTGSTPLDRQHLKEKALAELLRVIREEEPPRPSTRLSTSQTLAIIAADRGLEARKLSGLVRGELDWIVMKALEKDRSRRYETANGLSRDIERYLHDEPVQACPPSAVYRFRKFARRNKVGLAVAALILLFLLLLGGGVGWVIRDRATRQAVLTQEVTRALEETASASQRDRFAEAMSALKRAEGLLAEGPVNEQLRERVRQWRADLDLVAQSMDARMLGAQYGYNTEGYYQRVLGGPNAAIPLYESAFKAYGIRREFMTAEQAAQRIRSRPPQIQLALIAALDHWISSERLYGNASGKDEQKLPWLKALVRAVDTDRWRQDLRTSAERKDYSALPKLAGSPEIGAQAPYTLNYLALVCEEAGQQALGIEVLRRTQQSHPDDFWINYTLGRMLRKAKPPQPALAVRFSSIAVSLRPDKPVPHVLLGITLTEQGSLDEAIAEFHKATVLKPDDAKSYFGLAINLRDMGRLDEAIDAYRRVNALRPDFPGAFNDLGLCFLRQGKWEDASAPLRKAIALAPNFAAAHLNLGIVLMRQGRLDEAVAELRTVVKLEPNNAIRHSNLGILLQRQGKPAEATAEWRKAISIQPDCEPAAWYLAANMACCPDPKLRDPSQAVEMVKKWIDRDTKSARWWQVLGWALYRNGDWKESIAALEKSIELGKEGADADQLFFLAMAHWHLGQKDESRGAYDRAIQWIEKNKEDLGKGDRTFPVEQFRAEAAELMGIQQSGR